MQDEKRSDEPLIVNLQKVISWAVRLLAVLMVAVIIMGVVDVGWVMTKRLMSPPSFLLTIPDILAIFGAFMAVLIAIEIFVNITIYLREDVIHIKIVIATALMAVARKIIVLDSEKAEAIDYLGLAALILAASIAYMLVHKTPAFKLNYSREESFADSTEFITDVPPSEKK